MTLKHSTKLKTTYETQNWGDIELRTTKHASPYYMYSLSKVLRVGKMTSNGPHGVASRLMECSGKRRKKTELP